MPGKREILSKEDKVANLRLQFGIGSDWVHVCLLHENINHSEGGNHSVVSPANVVSVALSITLHSLGNISFLVKLPDQTREPVLPSSELHTKAVNT